MSIYLCVWTHVNYVWEKKRIYVCTARFWKLPVSTNDTAFIKIVRTVVPAAHGNVNIFLWPGRRQPEPTWGSPHGFRIRIVNFDKKLSLVPCCCCSCRSCCRCCCCYSCCWCYVAGSRKTRHQFIWPELSLAGLIHFASVCRWAALGVRLANQTNQMTLSF